MSQKTYKKLLKKKILSKSDKKLTELDKLLILLSMHIVSGIIFLAIIYVIDSI